MNEPCDFVKLVLQRMDSNPEEFEHYGRWNTLCESLERYAGAYTGDRPIPNRQVLWAYDQFEIDLMVAKYRGIYRDREYKNMLKSILMGNEPKAEGTLMRSSLGKSPLGYQNITPRQLYADTTTTAVGSGGQQYATNIAASSTTSNPQLRAMMDDAIEARMKGSSS
jgi:hypothetical protein